MDDKTNLYVFAKKEVALIFLSMILVAVTSFIFGVKIGKSYSYKVSGLDRIDREKVEMLSKQEENVAQMVEQRVPKEQAESKDIMDNTYNKLKQEFNKLEEESSKKKEMPVKTIDQQLKVVRPTTPGATVKTNTSTIDFVSQTQENKKEKQSVIKSSQFSGKFTLQLGSHQSLTEAEKFADGFRVRGYNPIINEVELKDHGTWYRISLGVFDSIDDAKKYIIKESALFQGQDYVINRFE